MTDSAQATLPDAPLVAAGFPKTGFLSLRNVPLWMGLALAVATGTLIAGPT